jgi:hypothetical protein
MDMLSQILYDETEDVGKKCGLKAISRLQVCVFWRAYPKTHFRLSIFQDSRRFDRLTQNFYAVKKRLLLSP